MSSLFGNFNNPPSQSSPFNTNTTQSSTNTSQLGSLFGGLNSKPTTAGTSLFGSLGSTSQPQTQQQGGGGIFGSIGSTSQPQQQSGGSSLFGGLGSTSQPQTQQQGGGSSLFGGLGSTSQPQTQQQGGGGLFGGIGSTSQPQQQSGGSSLFGGLGSTSQPQAQTGNNLFGGLGTSTQAQQPQNTGSVLGGLGANSQSQPLNGGSIAGGGVGSISQPQQNGQSNAYFNTILERSRKRALGETMDSDFPQLQLGLGDLRERIKRLAPSKADSAVDGKAHYLLAASGVDPGAAVRDLNQFNATTGRVERAQLQELPDTDVDGYLANVQTQTTLSMISDGLARSIRDFDTFLEDNVTMEWDAQRKRIYQHFGIAPIESTLGGGRSSFAASASEPQGAFGRSRRSKAAALAGSRVSEKPSRESKIGKFSAQKSVIGAAGPLGGGHQPLFADVEKKMEANGIIAPGPNDRFQRERQSRYIEKVQDLNEARLKKRVCPVLYEFAGAVRQAAETHSEKVANAYGALIEMIQENSEVESQSDPLAVKERQFAAAYLDETPNSQKNKDVKKKIIRGSARFLEKQFFEKLEANVAKNPREANLGGIPNVLSKVKAYVRLKAARKDLAPDNTDLQMLDDDFVWALVYYLLRSGHVQEALEYVAANAVAFRAIDRNFASYIMEYANNDERMLGSTLRQRINSEFNQRLRVAPPNSIDPYRMACYKIIGRCELNHRTLDGLNLEMEDYMWLQFVLAREVKTANEMANEVCNLADIQKTIKEIGSRYFVKSKDVDFGTYFFLLILGGFFEEAVEYLFQFSHTDAVHVAIALDFYGLLRVSDPNAAGDDLFSYTTRGLPQLDFGRMVGYYTRDFRAANVSAAVDYLCLICLNQDLPGEAGRKQVALCHEALRELVLESREFALLLGDIRPNGQRLNGAIVERQMLIGLHETDDFMRAITIQAASIADDNGRTTDAVLLYHLAEEYDNVVVILTRAVSEAVNTPIGQEHFRLQPLKPRASPDDPQAGERSLSLASIDDPVTLARAITNLYNTTNMYMSKIKVESMNDCTTLLTMSNGKTLVEQGDWMTAVDVIKTLDILPLQTFGNASEIRSYATKFSSFSQPIANAVPTLLLWTILCCNGQRAHLMSVQFGGNEGTRRLMIENMRQMNMDLTTYTSQLRYRFPGHIHEALARAQSA